MTMLAAATMLLLQAAPATVTPAADPALARMAALFDEVCLQAFPIDGAVDRLMTARGATPMTPERVKITLKDDPGRGWSIEDGARRISLFVEDPPYHACSVRRTVEAAGDLAGYRTLAARFEADHPGFAPIAPYDRDQGDVHIHGTGESRSLAGGSSESLFVFDQHVTDPARRAKGETAVDLRFVHQIHTGG